MNVSELDALRKLAGELDGVLTISDARVLFSRYSDAAMFKNLESLVHNGLLVRVKRGVYALPSASLVAISQRLARESYISAGTVLAEALVIGSLPVRRVQAVKVGRPRIYRCALGVVEHLSVKENLLFGYEVRNGVRYATPEKAFIDVCYFLSKGRRFSFDPVTDVNLELLNPSRIREYLSAYDQRFVTFFQSRWSLP